jgi:hypothetical protein
MPVTVKWLDEAQTILLIAGDKFTSAELSAAKPEISRLQQSVQHPIGIIQDMRNFSPTSYDVPDGSKPVMITGMSQIGGTSDSSGHVAAIAFVYSTEILDSMNQMFSLAAKLLPDDSRIATQAFSSIEAAADFISGILKQSE